MMKKELGKGLSMGAKLLIGVPIGLLICTYRKIDAWMKGGGDIGDDIADSLKKGGW